MKIIKITLSLVLFISLFACLNNEENKQSKKSIIEGKIKHYSSDLSLLLAYQGNKDSLKVNNDGSFSFTKEIDNSGSFVTLFLTKEGSRPSKFKLYLEANKKLSLEIDANELMLPLIFTGELEKENNYIQKSSQLISSIALVKDDFVLTKDLFVTKLDSFISKYNFEMKNDIESINNETFKLLEENRLKYINYTYLIMYPSWNAYLNQTEELDLGKDYYDFLAKIDRKDSSLLVLDEYNKLIYYFIDLEINKLNDTITENNNVFVLDIIDKEFSSQKIRNYLYGEIMSNTINIFGSETSEELMVSFTNRCTDLNILQKVNSQMAEWRRISKGQLAPGFTFNDKDGNSVSLSDFVGKVVYIDVWATWCGPCRREIPFFEKLKVDFANQNIQFIGISVDDDVNSWLEFINRENMSGLQLHADGAWNSTITKDYLIKGIPRFILIDQEGKIVNSNATRPSGNIAEELNQLLLVE